MAARAASSIWQSIGLLTRRFRVRVPGGPPTACSTSEVRTQRDGLRGRTGLCCIAATIVATRRRGNVRDGDRTVANLHAARHTGAIGSRTRTTATVGAALVFVGLSGAPPPPWRPPPPPPP